MPKKTTSKCCGQKIKKSTIETILANALSDNGNCEMVCPKCTRQWDLDAVSDMIGMTDEAYECYSAIIATRTSPLTKQCPFCHTKCLKPDKLGNVTPTQVRCGNCESHHNYSNIWCWKCCQPWLNGLSEFYDCGNADCPPPITAKNGTIKSVKHTQKRTNKRYQKLEMNAGTVGLQNLGNTCFMNAALQCALQCPEFVELFFDEKVKIYKNKQPLAFAWKQFVRTIYSSNTSSVAPYGMKRELHQLRASIGNGDQEDSFYAISTLLNGLDEELCPNDDDIEHEEDVYDINEFESKNNIDEIAENKVWAPYTYSRKKSDNRCVVRETFDGVECERLTCVQCEYQLRVFKTFRQIELPLFQKNLSIAIKVYTLASDAQMQPFEIQFRDISCDYTMDGLQELIFASKEWSNQCESLDMGNKTDLVIKFGYVNTIGNQNKDINKYFRYLKGTDDCTKIEAHSQICALVRHKDDKARYIPRFNVICTKNDRFRRHDYGDVSFVRFWKPGKSKTGQAVINHIQKVTPEVTPKVKSNEHSRFILTIYYNNHVVKPKDNVYITENGCLLLIWVHTDFVNGLDNSPCVYPIQEYDCNTRDDLQIIQNAQIHHAKEKKQSMDVWESIQSWLESVMQVITDSAYAILQSDNQSMMEQAQKTQNKLKKLCKAEKLATNWLCLLLNSIQNKYKKNSVNNTTTQVLDNVKDCLKVYENCETSNANPLDCPRCKRCVMMVNRKVDVLKTPKILLLRIGRDNGDNEHVYGKRNDLIKYPIQALPFKNDIYDLFGVTVHSGSTTRWGHYYAYVKNLKNSEWFEMNDRSVSRIYQNKIVTNDATCLLYSKRLKTENEFESEIANESGRDSDL